MIPGDIGTALAGIIGSAVAAGELPDAAAELTASGTWRPVPAGTGGGPGSYASSLPFTLARLAARPAERIAAQLAEPLGALPWVSATRTTRGYLTVTVTAAHLASLPARIVAAGPAAAHSDALAGQQLTVPDVPDLAATPTWAQAWRSQHEALAGRLGHAAGADIVLFATRQKPPSASAAGAGPRSVAAAVAYHGLDAVRYALAGTAGQAIAPIRRQLTRPLDLSNPFVLVRYAHADASSTLRWAADLGLSRAAEPSADLLSAELTLIDAMSWLPERVAAAFRRRRPAELAAYLEWLAGAWLDCAELCPALPFRGAAASAGPAGARVAGRLELADAARVALAAGLRLLAVTAPARI